ncbi:MAG: DUF2842 domain-containing protein [Pseudomonadota bacterium]
MRKLIGTVLLAVFLSLYALLAMGAAIVLQVRESVWIEPLYYVVAGLLWVVPAGLIVWWMQKPDVDTPPQQR